MCEFTVCVCGCVSSLYKAKDLPKVGVTKMSLIPTNSQGTCYFTGQNRGRAGDVTYPQAAILEILQQPRADDFCLYNSSI